MLKNILSEKLLQKWYVKNILNECFYYQLNNFKLIIIKLLYII